MSIKSGALSKNFVVVQNTAPSSPFEGQIWVDTSSVNTTKQYKNGSWESITQDQSNLKTAILEAMNGIARNSYANSLAQENYDKVFYDVFVDQSKINSNSGDIFITTGQNGYINTKGFYESFEDGSVTDWDEPGGATITADNSTSYEGSYSGRYDYNTASNPEVHLDLQSSTASEYFFYFKMDSTNTDIGPSARFYDQANGDFVVGGVRKRKSGNGQYVQLYAGDDYTQTNETMTDGTWYKCIVTVDWNKPEITTEVPGLNISFTSTNVSAQQVDQFRLRANGGASYPFYIDNIGSSEITSSGSITTVQKSLGFTPSKLLLQQEASLTNNSEIKYTISDNSGNNTEITQSEIGKEVSLSFTDGDIDLVVDLTNNGGKCKLEEYGVMFV